MRWSGLLAAMGGALVLAAAQTEDTTPGIRLLETLTKGVPAADLLAPTAEVETEGARAAGLLDGGAAEGCRARCGEAATALEALCAALIRPEAARSEAVCYARAAELAAGCRAQCPR